MFRRFPSPSPGPKWEALQEPEASSDELDTEDGEVNTLLQPGSTRARFKTQRARDPTRDPLQSAPPAFANTSTNIVVGDNSRSHMKRKESESLFTSQKRARHVQAARSDQDDVMDLDLNEHVRNKRNMGIHSKSTQVQKTTNGLGGRQSGAPLSIFSITMNRKQSMGNSSTSPSTPTGAKPNLLRKKSAMKPPLFFPKRPSELAMAESNRPAIHDPPSKLAGLPFDTYKRAESKTVPASDPSPSMVPASPLDKPVDEGKAPLKRRRVPSASQTTRRSSTSKTKVIPPDAEIIEISEDDSPPPSISKAKSKSKSIRPSSIEKLSTSKQARQHSRTPGKNIASGSAPSSATKKFLPKAPIEVIEILDSDEEQSPSKAQLLQQKNVGISFSNRLSELVQECATGSNARRGQSRHLSSSGGDSFEGSDVDIDGMDIDEARNLLQPASAVPGVGSAYSIASDSDNYLDDLFDIPSSPRASSQEIQATDDTSNNQALQGLIPLPSSSPSSIGLSPRDKFLSTPPAPTTSTASSARSSFSQQPSTSTSIADSVNASAGTSTSTSTYNNRLGFSSVAVPPSLQAPPPARKYSAQFARKSASLIPPPMSDQDEDSSKDSKEPSEKKWASQTKANKGKEKEIRQSSPSNDTEYISMGGLRAAWATYLDKPAKQQPVLPTRPKITQGQTLAEVITSAGQLNRTKKKIGRRLQGNAKDVPLDRTSDVEGGVKDGPTVDQNEKALKAAIGSSRLLVNLLPTLKEKNSVSLKESSSQERKLSLGPPRTQEFHSTVKPAESPPTGIERSSDPLSTLSSKRNIMAHGMPSQKPPPSLPAEMLLKSEPSVGKTSSATNTTAHPQTEQPTVFGFKSGTAVIRPPDRIPFPKRHSASTLERISAVGSDSSGTSQQASPTGTNGLSGEGAESDGHILMTDASSMSIPFPLSPSQPVLMNSATSMPAKPFKRITPSKRSALAMTETSIIASTIPGDKDSSTLSQHSTSIVGRSSGRTGNDDASLSVIVTHKSHSPKSANVLPVLLNGPNDVRTQSPGKQPSLAVTTQPLVATALASTSSQPATITHSSGGEGNSAASRTIIVTKSVSPKSYELPITSISTETASSRPQPTAANNSIARDITLEATLPSKTPLSMHQPDSSSAIVPTGSSDTAAQDKSFDTLGLLSDDSGDGDEEGWQALLLESYCDDMDVVPSRNVQPSLQESIVVGHKAQINLDTSVASSSASTSISAIEVFNERINVSPPVPEVPPRRSSRRSSRSSTSEGLGIAFNDDFGFDSVPATRTPTPEDQEPFASTSPGGLKTYGGFRALTWKDFRKDLNNFIPKSYYAKDLPHALQDHINSMSEYTQMMGGMRDLFKATILENTVEDEPDAPPIEILNNVDTQATPPWEFYYTNHMWLGEGVSPPDIKNLVSCTCKGGCNPKSKTCACLLRQREVTSDPLLEFAYEKNGKLKIPGYPIFECNDLCGCSDECRNRVVQHGRKVSVNIAKTETKGWGVFAGHKKIPGGTFIGIYSGELLTDAEAHERGIKYNKFGRTYLFDLDFHHLKEPGKRWENRFTVDAYHAGNNHSCDPNCRLYACYINEGNIQKPLLAIFSRRDIEPYEEICFNYQGSYPDNDDDDDSDDDDNNDDRSADPDHEKDIIYGQCRCGAKNCTGTMFK